MWTFQPPGLESGETIRDRRRPLLKKAPAAYGRTTFGEFNQRWESIRNESKFPFPIVTFKQEGVWRALNAARSKVSVGVRKVKQLVLSHAAGESLICVLPRLLRRSVR